jgi:hypothetical protein
MAPARVCVCTDSSGKNELGKQLLELVLLTASNIRECFYIIYENSILHAWVKI